MTSAGPFLRTDYDLGSDTESGSHLALAPISASEAERLGAAFAAIDPWARYPYPPETLAAYFAGREAGAPRFALRLGAQTVGVVGLRLNWLHGPYMQFLGVLPGFQRRGLGGEVLSWFDREARAGEARNLWVAASDFNSGAISFYERQGFARVVAIDGLVRSGRSEILMRKRL